MHKLTSSQKTASAQWTPSLGFRFTMAGTVGYRYVGSFKARRDGLMLVE